MALSFKRKTLRNGARSPVVNVYRRNEFLGSLRFFENPNIPPQPSDVLLFRLSGDELFQLQQWIDMSMQEEIQKEARTLLATLPNTIRKALHALDGFSPEKAVKENPRDCSGVEPDTWRERLWDDLEMAMCALWYRGFKRPQRWPFPVVIFDGNTTDEKPIDMLGVFLQAEETDRRIEKLARSLQEALPGLSGADAREQAKMLIGQAKQTAKKRNGEPTLSEGTATASAVPGTVGTAPTATEQETTSIDVPAPVADAPQTVETLDTGEGQDIAGDVVATGPENPACTMEGEQGQEAQAKPVADMDGPASPLVSGDATPTPVEQGATVGTEPGTVEDSEAADMDGPASGKRTASDLAVDMGEGITLYPARGPYIRMIGPDGISVKVPAGEKNIKKEWRELRNKRKNDIEENPGKEIDMKEYQFTEPTRQKLVEKYYECKAENTDNNQNATENLVEE